MTKIGYIGGTIGLIAFALCVYLFKRYSESLTDRIDVATNH